MYHELHILAGHILYWPLCPASAYFAVALPLDVPLYILCNGIYYEHGAIGGVVVEHSGFT